ncbi:MAG: AtpZ/AtpI family protein [Acetobacteraceae bacterium]
MEEPPVGRPERPASSFEERLQAARQKRGLEPARTREGEGMGWVDRPLAMAFRLAGEMVASLVVGVAIGWWLDRVLGTAPWLLLLFVVLGTGAGILNVWRVAVPKEDGAPKDGGAPKE